MRIKPPTRNGVGPSSVTLPVGEWRTIIDFLAHRFDVPRSEWIARMDRGDVIDELAEIITPDSVYHAHRVIYYYRHIEHEPPIPFYESVLFRNEHFIVVDKPHFLPVMPAGRYLQETLLVRLKQSLKLDDLAPAHRIDRDTAGLVLFTTHVEARRRFAAMFRKHTIHKYYQAVASINPSLSLPMTYRSRLVESQPFMQMRTDAGEPNSETHIELLEQRDALGLYRLRPITGKKHQLRVQLCELGIPIVNDRIYPVLQSDIESSESYDKPLQLLARSLEFIDPFTGEQHYFESLRQLQW